MKMVLKFCLACSVLSAVSCLRLPFKDSEDVEAPQWEHYDEALDKDLYKMATNIKICMKVIHQEPQVLFNPGYEFVKNEQEKLGGMNYPDELPLQYFRASCDELSPTSCAQKLYSDAQAAMERIQGKTLMMIGDSTVRQNFLTFVCMMQLVEEPSVMTSKSAGHKFHVLKQSMLAARGQVCPTQDTTWCMSFPKSKVAIAFQWFHIYEHPDEPRMSQVMRDYQMGENDIVLLNLGLGHSNDLFRGVSRLDNSYEFSEASAKFEQATRTFMEDAMQPAIYTNGKLPQFMWRETTPQHFSTSTRIYKNPGDVCAAMDDEAIQHGANVANEIGNAVMTELGIPSIQVWKSLSGAHEMHLSKCFNRDESDVTDFTHYNLDVQIWMCGQEAKFLAQQLKY